VQDQNGHGSFVAGVVGAVGNNGLGVTGINQARGRPRGAARARGARAARRRGRPTRPRPPARRWPAS